MCVCVCVCVCVYVWYSSSVMFPVEIVLLFEVILLFVEFVDLFTD